MYVTHGKSSERELTEEIHTYARKPTISSGRHVYPYHELNDRQFETLLYSIFRKDIDSGVFDGQFDDVSLMVGVGEKGRDCGLYRCGNKVGLVQCKHSINPATRMSKPSVAREIIKFALYYLKDRSLISHATDFTYYIVVSADFTGPAIELLCDFSNQITSEGKFQDWVSRIISQYRAFHSFTLDAIGDSLCEVLRSITVKRMNASDLDLKLARHPDLVTHFFSVKMVVSVERLQAILNAKAEEAETTKKRELILQMASPVNSVAVEAVRMLRAQGWLQDGTLAEADLCKADLRKADLTDALLTGVHLSDACLEEAHLCNTRLHNAVMHKADLQSADFSDAEMKGAQLGEAKLQDAKNLTKAQLAEMYSLRGATMVNGKMYNGCFNLEGDLITAHLMRLGRSEKAMADYYCVSVDDYRWGQEWNRYSQSPPLMYSPDLPRWFELDKDPYGRD